MCFSPQPGGLVHRFQLGDCLILAPFMVNPRQLVWEQSNKIEVDALRSFVYWALGNNPKKAN